jgi:D-serine deaminase-like pyridoxal phosphate-dependent protein
MTVSLDPNGELLRGVSTPALVLDAVALDLNIARMADAARTAGVSLRPHGKTHKSPDVARRQRAAGAIGLCCATLLEAEEMAAAGIDGLLITSPVVGADKTARLAALHRRAKVMTVVDHPEQVDGILTATRSGDASLTLVIDVDIGQGRTGVTDAESGIALARRIAAEPRLVFGGLQAYAGHVQHIPDAPARQSAATESEHLVRVIAGQLRATGLVPRIVSGSGTGTSAFDLEKGPYSELQVGSYVFMDADYGRILRSDGSRLPFDNALFVLATVISANRAGQVTVDAGTKALAVNGPLPDRLTGVPAGSRYTFWGDEHGTIHLPAGVTTLPIGARILIGLTHCDPTVNLHPAYNVVTEQGTLTNWPIVGRYSAETA